MNAVHFFVAASVSMASVIAASAQEWLTRGLTLVVPFSAGGSSDTIARIRLRFA